MGEEHTKIYCFQIEGDASDEHWASYSHMAVFGAHHGELATSEALFTKLEEKNPFANQFSGDPFGTRRSGMNALDLYFGPDSDVSEILCAFRLPTPDKESEENAQVVFDTKKPFEIGDNGWPEPKQSITPLSSEDAAHWAAFKLNLDACRSSALYQKARGLREFPFVRFPIVFRVIDRKTKLPASMIPNTHSKEDISRFGNPGQLRLAEMQEHLHDHGFPKSLAHGSGEQGADRKHDGFHSNTTASALRHWGPHFANGYSVYLRVD